MASALSEPAETPLSAAIRRGEAGPLRRHDVFGYARHFYLPGRAGEKVGRVDRRRHIIAVGIHRRLTTEVM